MKTAVTWTLKNVVFPLAPFTIGAVIRLLYAGELRWDSFSATELAFSIVLMFVILCGSTAKLTDPALKEGLNSVFYIGIFVFIALFAIALFLEIHLATSIKVFVEATREGKLASIAQTPVTLDFFQAILNRVRYTTVGLGFLSVIFSLIVGKQYDLMQT